ncbi:hypothetical protein ACIG5E_00170 [Kitasatospora sp. NPDC053057]|uniref:hypothetical protein n=1 Tax=Kitasatospora sp. NPDC053057 TaxID=3364062 RepID=UPI0037C5E9F3
MPARPHVRLRPYVDRTSAVSGSGHIQEPLSHLLLPRLGRTATLLSAGAGFTWSAPLVAAQ